LKDQAISSVIQPAKRDFIFPIWIVQALPTGLSGLILAGVFAAAISSLDSILAALSQTTLSLLYNPEQGNVKLTEKQLVNRSRVLVILWGIILTAFTFGLDALSDRIPILPLAFGMTSYTVGPILAIFLAAMFGKGHFRGLFVGAVLSFFLVMFCRTDVWILLFKIEALAGLPEIMANLPSYKLSADGSSISSTFAYVWLWPVTTLLTFVCGLLIPPRLPKE